MALALLVRMELALALLVATEYKVQFWDQHTGLVAEAGPLDTQTGLEMAVAAVAVVAATGLLEGLELEIQKV